MAQQVRVPSEEWAGYDWQGRAIKRHRVEIRSAFGFRECTAEDQDQAQLAEWLVAELCGVELNRDRLAEAVVRCRGDRMEPPTPGRIARLVGSAVTTFEERFCAATWTGCRRRPVPGWTTWSARTQAGKGRRAAACRSSPS
ncbi:DUF4158 domain-containing protein [Streptomyces sp. R08]|uniref:DUF4158 domain-containing protein n=1 Tax=Streptomyces sp. R08 TaxID=3238624 RepID=A0AB39M8Z6_9ACTN